MGIFSEHPEADPKIVVEGIEVVFDRGQEAWHFTYRGTAFFHFESTLLFPTRPGLDLILETIESLAPEMRSRIETGVRELTGKELPGAGSYIVDLEGFSKDRIFCVSWSDDSAWGDLGVDFEIKDRVIIDECWGD